MAKKRFYSGESSSRSDAGIQPVKSKGVNGAGIYSNAVERFDEKYAGPLQRRRMEREDFSMLNEDHTKMANMPTEVKMVYYSKNRYSTYDLDDTIAGIDEQISKDQRVDVRRDGYGQGQQ
jgi:hypothetical protein